jgi:hypothetical protein
MSEGLELAAEQAVEAGLPAPPPWGAGAVSLGMRGAYRAT